MIKNMLKGRKYSNTYLATICRHRWSAQMMMKKYNKLELSASTVAFISNFNKKTGLKKGKSATPI